jgi:hypothetical protein
MIHTTAHASELSRSAADGSPSVIKPEQPGHPWLANVGKSAAATSTAARRLAAPAAGATHRLARNLVI